MTASWVPTFGLDDVVEAPRSFAHGDARVLVSLVDGEPHAMTDACLHRGASLAGGVCRDGIITCPSHWWRYDLRTGELQNSPRDRIETFPCRVVDGLIEVLMPEATPAMSLREALLAHARSTRSNDA